MHFTIENVTQYNRNVNLPQVNVSRVKTDRIPVKALHYEDNSNRSQNRRKRQIVHLILRAFMLQN